MPQSPQTGHTLHDFDLSRPFTEKDKYFYQRRIKEVSEREFAKPAEGNINAYIQAGKCSR